MVSSFPFKESMSLMELVLWRSTILHHGECCQRSINLRATKLEVQLNTHATDNSTRSAFLLRFAAVDMGVDDYNNYNGNWQDIDGC
jgi:hypothetical protein